MTQPAVTDTQHVVSCQRDAISYNVQRTSQIASATFFHDDPEPFHAR
ncbi:MAG: hypothetical protein RR326_16500 [Stenotrophomonas sp.]